MTHKILQEVEVDSDKNLELPETKQEVVEQKVVVE